jgi:predicted AAA+ superfamily ATPase
VYTDARGRKGEYLIAGSQHFLLLEKIAQSLAGRVSLFHLLPFSVSELRNHHFTFPDWEGYDMRGGYPRIRVEDIPPFLYYESYVKTYVERNVRLMKNIADPALFPKFLFLLAGRIGQLFNQSSLATVLGIEHIKEL